MLTGRNNIEPRGVMDHLAELRNKIFISLSAVVVGSIIAHFYHRQIIGFILEPTGSQQLIFLSPLEPLFFILKLDLLVGLVIAFPVISWCLLSYLRPALSSAANLIMVGAYLISLVLLVVGLAYAYFVTVPLSLKFLLSITIPGIENVITAKSYLSFFLAQAVILTVIFQIPILVLAGIYLKLFKAKTLASKRRHVYVFGLIALAVITPTTDLFSLGLVLIPTLLIFELSLVAGKILEALRRRFVKPEN